MSIYSGRVLTFFSSVTACRGTLDKEKPPIFGMIQRGGQVVIQILANVRQVTIEPLIRETVLPGTLIYTDEYGIYNRLDEWGYGHKSVNHGAGEFARDEDGDGFCEIHVNTMEGFWSLLRGWLRPHRRISQENLPLYLGFSSLSIMSADEEKPCSIHWLSFWSAKTLKQNMSQN